MAKKKTAKVTTATRDDMLLAIATAIAERTTVDGVCKITPGFIMFIAEMIVQFMEKCGEMNAERAVRNLKNAGLFTKARAVLAIAKDLPRDIPMRERRDQARELVNATIDEANANPRVMVALVTAAREG